MNLAGKVHQARQYIHRELPDPLLRERLSEEGTDFTMHQQAIVAQQVEFPSLPHIDHRPYDIRRHDPLGDNRVIARAPAGPTPAPHFPGVRAAACPLPSGSERAEAMHPGHRCRVVTRRGGAVA